MISKSNHMIFRRFISDRIFSVQLSVELIYLQQLPQKNRTWKTSSYNGDDNVWARSPRSRAGRRKSTGPAKSNLLQKPQDQVTSFVLFRSNAIQSDSIRIDPIRSKRQDSRLQPNEQPLLLFYYYLQNARTLYHLRVCSHGSRRRCRSRVVAV